MTDGGVLSGRDRHPAAESAAKARKTERRRDGFMVFRGGELTAPETLRSGLRVVSMARDEALDKSGTGCFPYPVSNFTLRVRNFRNLEHLEWSPAGVCLLCGPNGSGKSTTLDALKFLRALFDRGHEAAFSSVDGQYFRRTGTPEEAPVIFEISAGDLRWTLRFPMSSTGLKGTFGEELHRGDEKILRAAMFDEGWYLGDERHPLDEVRCCARVLWDRGDAAWMKPLVDLLFGFRVHHSFELAEVKQHEQSASRTVVLAGSGRNLWSVLANWKQSPLRYRGQFDAVIRGAREAFPELLSTIEFDRGLPFLFPPGATEPDQGLPPSRAADGLLTGLLHLTAVMGAKPGGVIALDEVENQLHPHAIRSLISAMRRRAEEKDLTIILTTHSPVVLNTFRDEPEQVYVLDRGARDDARVPAAMTEIHSEEWLAQAKLGTLYDQLAFGAPAVGGHERSPWRRWETGGDNSATAARDVLVA